MSFFLKPIVFLLCLTVFSTPLIAQNAVLDSLKQELVRNSKMDTLRVKILNELAFSYHKKKADSALIYLEESATISKASIPITSDWPVPM